MVITITLFWWRIGVGLLLFWSSPFSVAIRQWLLSFCPDFLSTFLSLFHQLYLVRIFSLFFADCIFLLGGFILLLSVASFCQDFCQGMYRKRYVSFGRLFDGCDWFDLFLLIIVISLSFVLIWRRFNLTSVDCLLIVIVVVDTLFIDSTNFTGLYKKEQVKAIT